MKYNGFDATSFKKDLERMGRQLKSDLPRAVHQALVVLADEIKDRAPVDTGTLRDSVRIKPVKVDGGGIVGEVEVEGGYPDGRWYVGFVEYGTGHTPPQPFIRPAIHAKEAEMIRIIESALPKE